MQTNDVAEPDPCYADVIFVVDESGSVTSANFDEVKSFMSTFVDSVKVIITIIIIIIIIMV